MIENANEGAADTVNATVDYTLVANVENLILQGAALQGYGNALATHDHRQRRQQPPNGGAGADAMAGGAGNDVYFVDNASDTVIENANEGTGHGLCDGRLSVDGERREPGPAGAGLQGYGNALANAIYGNSGNNLLDGDAGADAMFGGPATTPTSSTMSATR